MLLPDSAAKIPDSRGGVVPRQRSSWVGTVVVVLVVAALTFALGGIPLWEFIDARWGNHPQAATVVCKHCSIGSSSAYVAHRSGGGTTVVFRLPNGQEHETVWRAWFPPDKGDRIQVSREEVDPNVWESKGTHGWVHAIRGIIVIALGLAMMATVAFPDQVLGRLRRRKVTPDVGH